MSSRTDADVTVLDHEYVSKYSWSNTVYLSFRLHFEKLKHVPVLELDANEEFLSDQTVRDEFIAKVGNLCA